MYVQSLEIKKRERYEEDAGQLKGTVILAGDQGGMQINLSPEALTRIFKVIKEEVVDRAHNNAARAAGALSDAEHGAYLEKASHVGELSV
jgi:hypothetical protein